MQERKKWFEFPNRLAIIGEIDQVLKALLDNNLGNPSLD